MYIYLDDFQAQACDMHRKSNLCAPATFTEKKEATKECSIKKVIKRGEQGKVNTYRQLFLMKKT